MAGSSTRLWIGCHGSRVQSAQSAKPTGVEPIAAATPNDEGRPEAAFVRRRSARVDQKRYSNAAVVVVNVKSASNRSDWKRSTLTLTPMFSLKS